MSNLIKVCHVEHKYEAESIMKALTEEDIASAFRQTPSQGLLAMPGAMGIDDMGFDVIVDARDRMKAREVLIGMGVLGEDAALEDEAEEEAREEDGEEEYGDDPQARIEEQLETMGPVRAAFAKLGVILLLLLLIAFCTWGVDAVIAMIKAAMQK